MERGEAIKILARVKANWYRQPTDDITAAEWADCLVRVSYQAAAWAVDVYRDEGGDHPPTPGQVFKLAQKREQYVRDGQQRLTAPPPSAEEIARNKGRLREMMAGLLRKMP